MTAKDQALIEQARSKPWQDINEDEAETEDGRDALHRIAYRKYLREEQSSFGIS